MAKPNARTPVRAAPARPVAVRKTSAVEDLAAQYEGLGISNRAEDNIVPLIYLLQSNSPTAMKGHERYVKGAEAGDIWLRNAQPDIAVIKSEEGLLFQPCHLEVSWIEWLPDRGGLVARHATRPAEAELRDVEGDDGSIRKRWKMGDNDLNETREFAGFVHGVLEEPMPYTIPLSSTGLTIGKQWNTTMRDWRETRPDGSKWHPPMFYHLFRLTTKLITKNNNSWYQYVVEREDKVSDPADIERGFALHQAFEKGEKRSADEENLGDGVIDGDAETI